MAFADLKNDFVFRRVFASHPEVLRRLLNDLLERSGDLTIEALEYLPSELSPIAEGAKLSILDVRCKDRTGTSFVVEMQLLHHPGFINRVVFNACKAYVGQLKQGDWYTKLTDVVAISICDFELWPDHKQDKSALPRVPMLSRWNMTERASGNQGLLQVQYAFLELPKMPSAPWPEGTEPLKGTNLWAWLFAHAQELSDVPPDLTPGPYRTALELANKAKFSVAELQAYEKTRDEIRQVLEIADARWLEGKLEGKLEGRLEGRLEGELGAAARALLTVLRIRGIAVPESARARIVDQHNLVTLERWLETASTATSIAAVFDDPT